MKSVGWVLGIIALAAGLLFAWAFWKSRKPGSTGGVWGTIGGLWGGASDLTQSVTDKSMQAGRTLGGGVQSAASGIGGIAVGASSAGKSVIHNALPWNWF